MGEGILVLLALLILGGAVCGVVALFFFGGLLRRVRELESEVHRLKDRWLRGTSPAPPVKPPQPATPPPPLPEPSKPKETAPPLHAGHDKTKFRPTLPLSPPVLPRKESDRPKESESKDEKPASAVTMEMFVGTRLLGWVGAVIILFGLSYFLKFAYDQGWITPTGRLISGLVFGVALLIGGELLRRRGLAVIAQTFTGVGFAALYVCIYCALNVFQLWSQSLAFDAATAVTLLAILIAVRQNASPVCILALVGGYLSPVLLSTGENRPTFLFCYITIINMAAIGCATFRDWKIIKSLSFYGTVILSLLWYWKHYDPTQLTVALTFLSLFFLTFLALPLLGSLIRRTPATGEERAVLIANGVTALGAYGVLLFMDHRTALGLTLWGVGATFAGLFFFWRWRVRDEQTIAHTLLSEALVLALIGVPLALSGYTVPIVWAVGGVALVVLARRYDHVVCSLFSASALVLALLGLLHELPLHGPAFTPVWNIPFGAWLLVATACGTAGVVIRGRRRVSDTAGKPLKPASDRHAWVLCVGIVCLLLHLEVNAFWNIQTVVQGARVAVHNAESLVVLWSLLTVGTVLSGTLFSNTLLRWLALPVLALAAYITAEQWSGYRPDYTALF